MGYYIFKPAANTIETGTQFPQVQKMSSDYNYKSLNSVHALSREFEKFPDYTPNLDSFVLHSKSKLTDLLSVSVIHGGFLVSEKLKNIFEKFTLAPHRFYPAKLKHNKKSYENYCWMHIICDLTQFVDYPKSSFFIYYNYAHNLGNIDISSKEDFILKKAKVKKDNPGKTITIWANKITLIDSFDKNLDLFEIGAFSTDFFISEKLNHEIIKERITGCQISPALNLSIHS